MYGFPVKTYRDAVTSYSDVILEPTQYSNCRCWFRADLSSVLTEGNALVGNTLHSLVGTSTMSFTSSNTRQINNYSKSPGILTNGNYSIADIGMSDTSVEKTFLYVWKDFFAGGISRHILRSPIPIFDNGMMIRNDGNRIYSRLYINNSWYDANLAWTTFPVHDPSVGILIVRLKSTATQDVVTVRLRDTSLEYISEKATYPTYSDSFKSNNPFMGFNTDNDWVYTNLFLEFAFWESALTDGQVNEVVSKVSAQY